MIEPLENYERYEDMSSDGKIMVMMENDGDMIITIYQPKDDLYPDRMASAQFCTYAGGGQSPKVRKALIELANAILEDNREKPQNR